MIPFEKAWPYDVVMGDLYVPACPFCGADNVLLPVRPDELPDIRDGMKRLLVFPCCRNKVTIVDADRDYLLTDRVLRRGSR
ncbi:hypothetical protein [Paenibacillus arenilitoris]|uniref:Uncharacterized protein n=1 Tax=Paenibacillus arenilitoris TaxID=2772299 RepID=A0A927H5Q0_9BACL|nr:hypothetical protein [Paenibacillus arenilitoris]MBD2867784.1 hypothetical protein [Paenibacillus arenilitoris]